MNLQTHHHILACGQALMQIMRLEDEAQLATQSLKHGHIGPLKFLAQQANGSVLDLPQTSHQGEHGGFAEPDGLTITVRLPGTIVFGDT